MHNHDIYTGKDLYDKTEFELIRWFGKEVGLYLKARGIDHSEVKATRVRKSVGTERTFSTDVNDDEEILQKYGNYLARQQNVYPSYKNQVVR